MTDINLHTIATLRVDPKPGENVTLADVREFLRLTTEVYGLDDSYELLDCILDVELPIKNSDTISCMDHPVGEEPNDIILQLHHCPAVDNPQWFEASETIVKEMNPS